MSIVVVGGDASRKLGRDIQMKTSFTSARTLTETELSGKSLSNIRI